MSVSVDTFKYRLKPWAHQHEALQLSWQREVFALFMEQGTGKTKVIIDNAAMLYCADKIDMLVIVAPDGVQRAWIRDELQKHMSPAVPYISAWWENKPSKRLEARINALWDPEFVGLKVIAVNFETLVTPTAKAAFKKFLTNFRCMMAVDESHRIKNPKTSSNKVCVDLGDRAKYRRLLTGTPVANSPLDAFGQFQFLDPDILGISSFVAFKAHHAEIESDDSQLLRHIMQRLVAKYGPEKAGRMRPQLIKRDAAGRPIYRNLDELQQKLAPHSYRKLKTDCLDLPPKVYVKRYVSLTKAQRKIYEEVKEDFITEYNSTMLAAPMAITRLMRMAQITGGFFKADADTPEVAIEGGNPKLNALIDAVAETPSKVLIWARFVPELNLIADTLEEEYGEGSVARYWGQQSRSQRDNNKNQFTKSPGCRFFVSQPVSGGTGLDGLQVADTEIYFSNDFSLLTRLQSEDRGHRGGSEIHDKVTIIDIEAEQTLDRKIIESLLAKRDIADVITGDNPCTWI